MRLTSVLDLCIVSQSRHVVEQRLLACRKQSEAVMECWKQLSKTPPDQDARASGMLDCLAAALSPTRLQDARGLASLAAEAAAVPDHDRSNVRPSLRPGSILQYNRELYDSGQREVRSLLLQRRL
jgi:hypothetical protein